ncbi:hypothetical protein OF117_14415 [Geodermatophilus sp. YIM 151500]|uniref:hypothetical protein n=1 Tax=Geodermatophilus sp. YIM 151500 TaxID=2984531 RepID=UPI0021E3DC88|nr:hypothetical protein [Geodermatophilus sp. YIM 151500]MCV2490553.1 hypothetical protein [Geodermatophilus sp. YIM 151500]
MRGRALFLAGATAALAVLPSGTASAHPLGSFTVNTADHLVFTPDAVLLTAVVDRAEIPTAQALRRIGPDSAPSGGRLAAAASDDCAELAGDVVIAVDGDPARWAVGSTAVDVLPGEAGLPTLRTTCELRARVDLGRPATVVYRHESGGGPPGWREITADGEGVRLLDSPVPVRSPSDGLRAYPEDLLASPVDVRSFTVAVEPGEHTGAGAAVGGAGDPFGAALAALDRRLFDLVGGGITPLVGGLALLLAVLLGCGHALLPGHGKTVMAAYLTGRHGRPRDAVTVGATVTVTHTSGVLVLGVAVFLSSTLAGDQVLRWLGVSSGLLVALIGALLLRRALRDRRAEPVEPSLTGGPAAPVAGLVARAGVPATAGLAVSTSAVHRHTTPYSRELDHGHAHSHGHVRSRDHHHPPARVQDGHHQAHGPRAWSWGVHRHGPGGHAHGPGRGGLIGMGVAGGLVPSPSALVVLLASIGLGRSAFGVLLVVAYGLGMAATLTAVGLALVTLRDRLDRRLTALGAHPLLRVVARTAPVATAALVLLVGLALAGRGVLFGA